jgi:hypothetical protein
LLDFNNFYKLFERISKIKRINSNIRDDIFKLILFLNFVLQSTLKFNKISLYNYIIHLLFFFCKKKKKNNKFKIKINLLF